jgi:NAD(P)-dependent dehydrogenase (short-subunit alcohol dehydrogenase family)
VWKEGICEVRFCELRVICSHTAGISAPVGLKSNLNMKNKKIFVRTGLMSWVRGGFFSLAAVSLAGMAFAAEEKDMKNQHTVLITGANRGLGLEFAKKFQAAGYEVIGTARKPDEAAELKKIGAEVMELDVTSNEQIEALAKKLDGRKIDILINNAGIFPRTKDREDMMQTYSVNTLGPYFVSEALIPNLKKSDSPRIVNISSGLGQLTGGNGGAGGYSFSKAALNMVTRNLHSSHHRDGVIVISVNPGHNKTDMGGDGAPLEPANTAEKLLELVETLKPDQSGGFWMYDGEKLDW